MLHPVAFSHCTRRHLLGSVGVVLAAAACQPAATTTAVALKPGAVGSAPNKDGWTPVIPSSDLSIGANRFLYAVLDEKNRPIVDESIHLRFFDLAKRHAPPAVAAG